MSKPASPWSNRPPTAYMVISWVVAAMSAIITPAAVIANATGGVQIPPWVFPLALFAAVVVLLFINRRLAKLVAHRQLRNTLRLEVPTLHRECRRIEQLAHSDKANPIHLAESAFMLLKHHARAEQLLRGTHWQGRLPNHPNSHQWFVKDPNPIGEVEKLASDLAHVLGEIQRELDSIQEWA